jgi:hypothetical protein
MWAHYQKTFIGTQFVIVLVALGVYLFIGHSLARSAVFFGVMQLSAVIGALWAARIRAILKRRMTAPPLQPID